MSLAFVIAGAVLFVGGWVYQIYTERKMVKDRSLKTFGKKEWISIFVMGTPIALGMLLMMWSAFAAHTEWTEGRAGHMAMALAGGFFFGLSVSLLISGFAFHFWNSGLDEKTKKSCNWLLYGPILPIIVFFLLFLEGVAPYLEYPLVSGIKFENGTLSVFRAGDSTGNFHIAWYGLIILAGVGVCYAICDHKFYKKFGKHGIIDNLALIAFPAGIIGARIWYVVGNWSRMFAGRPFSNVFRIWDGGLTILGGAFLGIVAGVAFMLIRRKYVNIWWAMDICVPTILLAQAIGRWGNFFNCEVYGNVVNLADGWQWLPTWIANQMNISNSGAALPAGQIHVPLFLIESLINIAGYFIIVFAIGRGLKKQLKVGDLAGCYFLFYGVTRIIMEPMRDGNFNMGSDNSWSIVNSLIYILLGIFFIAFLHLKEYSKKENAKQWVLPLVGGAAAIACTLFLFAPSLSAGIIHTSSNVEAVGSYGGFELLFGGQAVAHLIAWILGLLGAGALLISGFLKEPIKKWMNIVSLPLLAAAVVIFLGGSSWTSLPKTQGSDELSYSMSYGFALVGLFTLFALIMSIFLVVRYIPKKPKKEEKKEEPEVIPDARD